MEGGGDVGQVRGGLAGAQEGGGPCGGAAGLGGRVAEVCGGLGGGQGRVSCDVVGDAAGAQPGKGVLSGVAVDAEAGGDGGGADGGVGVQQLGHARGHLVAWDLVPRALGPAGLGRGVAGAVCLVRLHRVAGPVLDPARLDAGGGEGGVALVDVPGPGADPEQRRALAAVQEVGVVLDLRLRERGDRLALEVGVDLLAVVQPRTGALRADRSGETRGLVGLEAGVVVDAYALLRGEIRQGAHEVLSACSDHGGTPRRLCVEKR